MKRIRLLILLSVLAVALPVGILSGVAKATGSTGATSQISINQNAQYDVDGSIVHIGLRVRCSSPLPGTVRVHLEQYPPETVVFADGDNLIKEVVCDGQTHSVGTTIYGANFDAGRAYATAAFTFPTTATATAAKWINIIVMPG